MKRVITPAVLLAAVGLALTGCGKKDDDAPKQAAGGELLPRSVSDDMLPYDTLQSQPSLAAPDAVLIDDGMPSHSRHDGATEAVEDSDAAVTPVATPTPTSSPATE